MPFTMDTRAKYMQAGTPDYRSCKQKKKNKKKRYSVMFSRKMTKKLQLQARLVVIQAGCRTAKKEKKRKCAPRFVYIVGTYKPPKDAGRVVLSSLLLLIGFCL